jgi:hypothetical protein
MQEVPGIIRWLNDGGVGTGIRESTWVFPIVESTHVLALALSVGVLIWFDFRLLGITMRHRSISQIHKQIMPLALTGFVIMFISGILLFWAEAEKAYLSGFFRIKVVFLFLAGLNALIFEMTTKRSIAQWDKAPIPPARVRLAGLLSILTWTAVISAGRATAYHF